jgi:hypothetical protein
MADRWRLRSAFRSYELELMPVGHDPDARDASLRALREIVAGHWDPPTSRVLREVYARLLGRPAGAGYREIVGSPASRVVDDELARAIRAGLLRIRRRELRIVTVPVNESDAEALGPQPEPTAWIEIELVDENGKPVQGVEYRIECEDGRVRTGTTNGYGRAREEGLHDGSCKVSFPKLNGPDWKAA